MAATAACTGSDGKSIATFQYDLNGQRTLHAYPPEPAAENRQEDKLHKRVYGALGDTKSPRTPYICVWRDPDLASDRSARPSKIFLTCAFGTDDWEPPAGIIEQAQARMQREEAVIRVRWDWRGDTYRLTRFEAEVRDLPAKLAFRTSISSADEITALRARGSGMKFPATLDDPFVFDLTVDAPDRGNRGEETGAPTAKLTIRGTAAPMPSWVMY